MSSDAILSIRLHPASISFPSSRGPDVIINPDDADNTIGVRYPGSDLLLVPICDLVEHYVDGLAYGPGDAGDLLRELYRPPGRIDHHKDAVHGIAGATSKVLDTALHIYKHDLVIIEVELGEELTYRDEEGTGAGLVRALTLPEHISLMPSFSEMQRGSTSLILIRWS